MFHRNVLRHHQATDVAQYETRLAPPLPAPDFVSYSDPEAPMLGCAILAAAAAGLHGGSVVAAAAAMVRVVRIVQPNPEAHQRYRCVSECDVDPDPPQILRYCQCIHGGSSGSYGASRAHRTAQH